MWALFIWKIMFCLLFVSRSSNHYLNPQIVYVQYSIIQNPFFGSISMPEISYTEQIIFVWLTWPSLTPLLLTSNSVWAQHCSGHWSDHPSVGRRSGSGSDLRCRAPESRTPASASGDIGERWAPGWGGADMQTPRTVNIVMNIYSCSPDPIKTITDPDIRPNTALGIEEKLIFNGFKL